MMQQTKQQKLIQILTKLSPYRSSAEWLIVLLENANLEEKVLDTIIEIINSSLVKLKNQKNIQKLQNIQKQLQLLQDQEKSEKLNQNPDEILEQL